MQWQLSKLRDGVHIPSPGRLLRLLGIEGRFARALVGTSPEWLPGSSVHPITRAISVLKIWYVREKAFGASRPGCSRRLPSETILPPF